MNESPNVVIVMSRCSRSGMGFGIRFEEQTHGKWSGDWAFAVKEQAARKEGYGGSEITGAIALAKRYPGCPHCHASGLYKCSCGKVTCWDGEPRIVTCPWCKHAGQPLGPVESLHAGGDR
jgi:hypothetical protein